MHYYIQLLLRQQRCANFAYYYTADYYFDIKCIGKNVIFNMFYLLSFSTLRRRLIAAWYVDDFHVLTGFINIINRNMIHFSWLYWGLPSVSRRKSLIYVIRLQNVECCIFGAATELLRSLRFYMHSKEFSIASLCFRIFSPCMLHF